MYTRLFLALLAVATTVFTPAAAAENTVHGVRVVVIDAGHGGNDPGACYAGVREKDLTLAVALRLGRLIEEQMPGVKVVYTRKTDKALSLVKADDLQARADIANKAEGDLFISIHVNAARSTSARGVETLIMGESPKEQRYNESALFDNNRDDLIDMSDERTATIVRAYIQNLQFTYGEYSMAMARCMQNSYIKDDRHSRGIKQQLLRVLYATDMPGVLTEIGFLSNPQEAAYLKSKTGQEAIARSLFRAVKNYSAYVMGARQAESSPTSTPEESTREQQPATLSQEQPATTKPESVRTEPATTPTKQTTVPAKPAPESAKPAAETPKKSATTSVSEPTEGDTSAQTKQTSVRYAIQVLANKTAMATSRPEFKKYRGKVREYKAPGTFRYKYCIYESADRATAQSRLAEVRKTFPQAFVVCCQGDRIVK